MFILKKIVALFFNPVPLCLEILAVGLLLLWCTRRQRAGKVMVTLGTGLLAVLSFSFGPNLLLKPLESGYPPLRHPPAQASVPWIVVLGGGVNSDPTLPSIARLSEPTRDRLLEGIRLHREMPGSKLILSGGAVFGPTPEAVLMGEVCRILGVNPRDVVLEAASRDTEGQARLIKAMVGQDRLVLVTSAFHMARSLALFRKYGLNPVPAPTGYLVTESEDWSPESFFPGARGLLKTEIAVHEYLGLAWAWLRGAI
jgi:uncharacterized SAM-binding protein YcdF (DUF218 family)